jgi:hypothetical protein
MEVDHDSDDDEKMDDEEKMTTVKMVDVRWKENGMQLG